MVDTNQNLRGIIDARILRAAATLLNAATARNYRIDIQLSVARSTEQPALLKYRGIAFLLKAAEQGVWKYQFFIGRAGRTGRIIVEGQTTAIERVRKRIDRELMLLGLEHGGRLARHDGGR
jgi:hypothetical protein